MWYFCDKRLEYILCAPFTANFPITNYITFKLKAFKDDDKCDGEIALDNADISMKCDRFVQNTRDLSQALLFWPFLAAQIPLDNVGHIGGGRAKFHSAPVSGRSLCSDVRPLQKRRLQCKILEITGAEALEANRVPPQNSNRACVLRSRTILHPG